VLVDEGDDVVAADANPLPAEMQRGQGAAGNQLSDVAFGHA
jgi:hypothetical protein